MPDFEIFRDSLREALYHLQDPEFEPADVLYIATGCVPNTGAGPVQARISEAIASLEPAREVPIDSRARIHFESLHRRFVLGLTQEEAAELLHMSVRNVQRVQKEAIHILARTMWQSRPESEDAASTIQAPDWRSQAGLEVASLRKTMPDARSDVGAVIQDVVELEAALASQRGVDVIKGNIQAGLTAATHPTVLRQTLITAIGALAPHISEPELAIYGTLEDGEVKITLTGLLTGEGATVDNTLIADIIAPPETSLEFHQRGQRLFLQIRLPTVGERIVLVVEDNPDMVYFYRRCTTGTRYRIVHIPPDQEFFAAVTETHPDLIILDVMLPEVDGWQLLSHLKERAATREIPVIVSSVVKEESLALALGADAFLSKPIRPSQFVAALDQALPPASSGP